MQRKLTLGTKVKYLRGNQNLIGTIVELDTQYIIGKTCWWILWNDGTKEFCADRSNLRIVSIPCVVYNQEK